MTNVHRLLLPILFAAATLLLPVRPGLAHSHPGAELPSGPSAAEGPASAARASAPARWRKPNNAVALRNAPRASRPQGSEIGRPRPAAGPGRDVPRDTWEHIRLMMTIVPASSEVSALRHFQRKLRKYHGNQAFFDRLGEQARPWLYHVTRRLAEHGVPGELALLPAVESGYDSAAVSSQKAAGLWQLHPDTALDLELPRSRWYDGRYDPVAATPAALDYLTLLHETFNGSWMLAVAAYNCGAGNVRRAIRRAGLRIEAASYPAIERHLPLETRGHMARWLVLSEIVAMPRLHNVRLRPVPWQPYFSETPTKPLTALSFAAKLTGVPVAELSRLNPGLKQGVTAPGGPHRLLLPADRAERFRGGLARMQAPTRPRIPANTAEWRHRVRKGDTLSTIARAYGATVAAIMEINGLQSHVIRIGRELTVPVPGLPSPLPPDRTPKRPAADVHVVSSGESLWLIARQYRITVDSLRGWNRLAPGSDLLRPGQKLRIPREGGTG